LLDASALEIDESLVSGESLPVTRTGAHGNATGVRHAGGARPHARATALDAEATRAAVFTTLVLGNIALIGAHRTRIRHAGGNPALWWVVGGSLACLAAALYWPTLGRLFRFEAPAPQTWLAVAVVLAALLLVFAVFARMGWRPAGTSAAPAAQGRP